MDEIFIQTSMALSCDSFFAGRRAFELLVLQLSYGSRSIVDDQTHRANGIWQVCIVPLDGSGQVNLKTVR